MYRWTAEHFWNLLLLEQARHSQTGNILAMTQARN
jgi:hypothetical protein